MNESLLEVDLDRYVEADSEGSPLGGLCLAGSKGREGRAETGAL